MFTYDVTTLNLITHFRVWCTSPETNKAQQSFWSVDFDRIGIHSEKKTPGNRIFFLIDLYRSVRWKIQKHSFFHSNSIKYSPSVKFFHISPKYYHLIGIYFKELSLFEQVLKMFAWRFYVETYWNAINLPTDLYRSVPV